MGGHNFSLFIAFLGRSRSTKYKKYLQIKIWTIFDREKIVLVLLTVYLAATNGWLQNLVQVAKLIQVASTMLSLPSQCALPVGYRVA